MFGEWILFCNLPQIPIPKSYTCYDNIALPGSMFIFPICVFGVAIVVIVFNAATCWPLGVSLEVKGLTHHVDLYVPDGGEWYSIVYVNVLIPTCLVGQFVSDIVIGDANMRWYPNKLNPFASAGSMDHVTFYISN